MGYPLWDTLLWDAACATDISLRPKLSTAAGSEGQRQVESYMDGYVHEVLSGFSHVHA